MTTEPQADIVERLVEYALDWRTRAGDAGLPNEAATEITRLRTELAEVRLQGRREGLEAWNRWYDAATADDDCEYLNGDGWKDAAKLRAIDPAPLLKDAGHGA